MRCDAMRLSPFHDFTCMTDDVGPVPVTSVKEIVVGTPSDGDHDSGGPMSSFFRFSDPENDNDE